MPKNPLLANKIILSGTSGSGIFGADGTSIIDENYNVDAPITSTDLTLSGTLAVTGASTFTGAIQANGAVTVGVDDTGLDVKFFGATASSHLLWDESADNLIAKGTAGIVCQSPTGDGIGYGTGAGGAVTQGSGSGRSTAVTLSKLSGTITTDTTSLAAGASAEFTATNTQVALGDVVVVSQQSGSDLVAATAGVTHIEVVTVAAGSFIISVANGSTTTAETGAIIINYAVIKAVAA